MPQLIKVLQMALRFSHFYNLLFLVIEDLWTGLLSLYLKYLNVKIILTQT